MSDPRLYKQRGLCLEEGQDHLPVAVLRDVVVGMRGGFQRLAARKVSTPRPVEAVSDGVRSREILDSLAPGDAGRHQEVLDNRRQFRVRAVALHCVTGLSLVRACVDNSTSPSWTRKTMSSITMITVFPA